MMKTKADIMKNKISAEKKNNEIVIAMMQAIMITKNHFLPGLSSSGVK